MTAEQVKPIGFPEFSEEPGIFDAEITERHRGDLGVRVEVFLRGVAYELVC